MGAGSDKDSFSNKLKEIVERDPLAEYKLTWVPDPVRKRHKVRMTLRTIPEPTSLGFDDVDLSEFCILPDTE